jgi:hypothetical protein
MSIWEIEPRDIENLLRGDPEAVCTFRRVFNGLTNQAPALSKSERLAKTLILLVRRGLADAVLDDYAASREKPSAQAIAHARRDEAEAQAANAAIAQ